MSPQKRNRNDMYSRSHAHLYTSLHSIAHEIRSIQSAKFKAIVSEPYTIESQSSKMFSFSPSSSSSIIDLVRLFSHQFYNSSMRRIELTRSIAGKIFLVILSTPKYMILLFMPHSVCGISATSGAGGKPPAPIFVLKYNLVKRLV